MLLNYLFSGLINSPPKEATWKFALELQRKLTDFNISTSFLKMMQVYKGGNSIEYYWLLVAMWWGVFKKNLIFLINF
jgi:hypothetical protein